MVFVNVLLIAIDIYFTLWRDIVVVFAFTDIRKPGFSEVRYQATSISSIVSLLYMCMYDGVGFHVLYPCW